MSVIWKTGGIILALLVVAAVILIILHKKTITSGEFSDLLIGETKSQVFLRLQRMSDITAITTEENEKYSIGSKDVERLSLLEGSEGFNVTGPGGTYIFFLDNGKVSHIVDVSNSGAFTDIQVGSSYETLKEEIEKYLKGGGNRWVISRPIGYGHQKTKVWVDATNVTQSSEDEAYSWLMSRNIWIYNNNNRYTNFRLYFEGDRLGKIVFRNYYIELP